MYHNYTTVTKISNSQFFATSHGLSSGKINNIVCQVLNWLCLFHLFTSISQIQECHPHHFPVNEKRLIEGTIPRKN